MPDNKIPHSRSLNDGLVVYPIDHPERFFQKEKITTATKFLWYVSKDETGFHAVWTWSEDMGALAKFLVEGLAKRQLLKEFSLPNVNQDINLLTFDETLTLCFAASLGNKTINLDLFSSIAGGEATLLRAASQKTDLNVGSSDLMDATSHFFWSLSWQFYDNKEDALKIAKTHPLFNSRDFLENAFQNDSSL